ncbi:MAG: hypothetical protein AAF621_04245, partial [Pseudomonadota bacterium]
KRRKPLKPGEAAIHYNSYKTLEDINELKLSGNMQEFRALKYWVRTELTKEQESRTVSQFLAHWYNKYIIGSRESELKKVRETYNQIKTPDQLMTLDRNSMGSLERWIRKYINKKLENGEFYVNDFLRTAYHDTVDTSYYIFKEVLGTRKLAIELYLSQQKQDKSSNLDHSSEDAKRQLSSDEQQPKRRTRSATKATTQPSPNDERSDGPNSKRVRTEPPVITDKALDYLWELHRQGKHGLLDQVGSRLENKLFAMPFDETPPTTP